MVALSSCVGGTVLEPRAATLCAQQRPATRAADKPVEKIIVEALGALENGDQTAARVLFSRALGVDPKNVTAHTYLGVIADQAGELAEAERHFAAAAIAAPQLPSARNNLGAILLRLGRSREAVKHFETSLQLDGNQPNALVNLAQIRFADGKPDDLRAARELFKRAYKLEPDTEIARALTVIALRLEDRSAAAEHYRDYSTRVRVGESLQVTSATARADLGGALLEAGLYREAAEELKAAAEAEPSNADTIVRLARSLISLEDLPAAGRTLESALARGLNAAPIYALLASVYEKSGYIENAIPAMKLAIERDPRSEEYRFAYGMLLTGVAAPAAAVIRLEESLALFPNSARLSFALGLAHFKGNKNEEAAKALTRAIKLDSKFAPAYAYLGMTFVELGRYEEAVKLYDQALAADEKLGVVHYLIADVLLKKPEADLKRIESHLVRSVRMDDSFAPARLALARVFLRTNRVAEAASESERVIAADPKNAAAYYQLGRAYMRLGRKAEAQRTLDTFKRLSEEQKEQSQGERREIVRRLANVKF